MEDKAPDFSLIPVAYAEGGTSIELQVESLVKEVIKETELAIEKIEDTYWA